MEESPVVRAQALMILTGTFIVAVTQFAAR